MRLTIRQTLIARHVALLINGFDWGTPIGHRDPCTSGFAVSRWLGGVSGAIGVLRRIRAVGHDIGEFVFDQLVLLLLQSIVVDVTGNSSSKLGSVEYPLAHAIEVNLPGCKNMLVSVLIWVVA